MAIPHPIKQLITLIGQSGGTITLPLAELQELGVEISATNICSDKGGELVLRLGPKIYYIPAPAQQEEQPQWPARTHTTEGTEADESQALPPASGTASILAKELEAVNRLTNRPRPEPRQPAPVSPPQQRVVRRPPSKQASRPLSPPLPRAVPEPLVPPEVEEVLPFARVGVTRLDDAALWMREQATVADKQAREKHDPNKYRDGDLPFRTMRGR